MTIQIQWPGDAESLQQALGLKGRVPLVVDEVVAPVVVMQDIPESPWSSHNNVYGGFVFAFAPAGMNGGVMAIPGPGVTLGITSVTVRNSTGGTFIVHVGIIAPVTIPLVTEGTPVDFRNVTNGIARFGGSTGIPVTGSRAIPVQSANQVGALFWQSQVGGPALGDDARTFTFPEALYVDGDLRDDVGQAGGVIVWCNTQNTEMTVSFAGREYPNRA